MIIETIDDGTSSRQGVLLHLIGSRVLLELADGESTKTMKGQIHAVDCFDHSIVVHDQRYRGSFLSEHTVKIRDIQRIWLP